MVFGSSALVNLSVGMEDWISLKMPISSGIPSISSIFHPDLFDLGRICFQFLSRTLGPDVARLTGAG